MTGIYAVVPMYIGIVFLMYAAAACGNAFHRLLTSLAQAELIREGNVQATISLSRHREGFRVRRRQMKEALDSRERFLDELQRSLDAREDSVADREGRMVAVEAREAHFDTVFHRFQALRVTSPRRSLDKDVVEVTVQVDTEVWAGLCQPGKGNPKGFEGYVANLFARECERVIKETDWGRSRCTSGPGPPLTSVDPAFAFKQFEDGERFLDEFHRRYTPIFKPPVTNAPEYEQQARWTRRC